MVAESDALIEHFGPNDEVKISVTPIHTGTARFVLKVGGRELFNEDYSKVFDSGEYPRQQRAALRNRFKEQLTDVDGIDADAVGEEIEDWLDDMKEAADDLELVGPVAQEIIEGTQTPVEIREAPDENTTWHVTLEFRGRTRELEFDAGIMVGDGSDTLATKLVHNYNEVVDITAEDWREIRDYWVANKRVVDRTDVTARDAVADRVLSLLSDRIEPTYEREKIGNSVAGAWVDVDNNGGAEGTAGPVVWVKNDLFDDEIETAGKNLAYKSQLVQTLRARDDLYDKTRVRSWTPSNERLRMWAFAPEALGVDPESEHIVDSVNEPASSEVQP